MEYRSFGRTGRRISEVSFGAWAIGGAWGTVDDAESMTALHAAVDAGVNLIDTADVYGMGRSERLIAQLKKERKEDLFVATKAGRRLNPHVASGYTPDNIESFIDDSRKHLEMDTLDLVQLHCPPVSVYYNPELFEALDGLKKKGKIQHYGVSVEKVEEALKAIEYPGVESVQIIFNCFRQRPAGLLFAEAKRRNVAILARVPLASGMLTGKLTRESQFAEDDHRQFNRHGERFDRGETFSGVDYETALAAVEELKQLLPPGVTLSQFALRWILMHEAVTCAIPGGKRPEQVKENCAASGLPALTAGQMEAVRELYERRIAPLVHHRW